MTSSLQGEEGDAGQSWEVGWPTWGVSTAGHAGGESQPPLPGFKCCRDVWRRLALLLLLLLVS